MGQAPSEALLETHTLRVDGDFEPPHGLPPFPRRLKFLQQSTCHQASLPGPTIVFHPPQAASPLTPDRPASFGRRSSPPFPLGILSSRASPFPRPLPLKPSRLPRRCLCPRQAGAGTGRQTGGQLEWREASLPGKPGGGLQDWATCGQGQVSLPLSALAVSLSLDM